jgi:hypothetical protein
MQRVGRTRIVVPCFCCKTIKLVCLTYSVTLCGDGSWAGAAFRPFRFSLQIRNFAIFLATWNLNGLCGNKRWVDAPLLLYLLLVLWNFFLYSLVFFCSLFWCLSWLSTYDFLHPICVFHTVKQYQQQTGDVPKGFFKRNIFGTYKCSSHSSMIWIRSHTLWT